MWTRSRCLAGLCGLSLLVLGGHLPAWGQMAVIDTSALVQMVVQYSTQVKQYTEQIQQTALLACGGIDQSRVKTQQIVVRRVVITPRFGFVRRRLLVLVVVHRGTRELAGC